MHWSQNIDRKLADSIEPGSVSALNLTEIIHMLSPLAAQSHRKACRAAMPFLIVSALLQLDKAHQGKRVEVSPNVLCTCTKKIS